jgi:hypothetical protein
MEGGGMLPEDVAGAAREMMETRGEEEARPEASVESALQLREALREVEGTERQFLLCDSVESLPKLARVYAEAHERASAAMAAVQRETGTEEVPVLPRSGITTRG